MQQVPLIGVKNGVGTTAALPLQGRYLHVDPNDGFIRSGKATANGRSFAARLKQHAKAAELSGAADIQLKFNTTDPIKKATVDTSKTRAAYYEDLKVYCGAAFAADADPTPLFMSL